MCLVTSEKLIPIPGDVNQGRIKKDKKVLQTYKGKLLYFWLYEVEVIPRQLEV